MKVAAFVKEHAYEEVTARVAGEAIAFVVFDWSEVKEREEDGGSNVWEYFIGEDTDAQQHVEAGRWIPLGAGGMYAGALKYDGGFQEMGHQGMIFADVSASADDPPIVYFNVNGNDAPVVVAPSLSALL